MKSKLSRGLFIMALGSAVLTACRSSKLGQKIYCNIDHRKVEFSLSTATGFEEIKSKYPGYAASYGRLIDSLNFSNADTIALFIRPCFLHRGVSFKVHNRVMSSYYFDFSTEKRQVFELPNNCDMAKNYFAFLTQENKVKATGDTVVIIPDCSIDFFLKTGVSFFYGTIHGSQISQYLSSSTEFKTLLKETDSLVRIYNESR